MPYPDNFTGLPWETPAAVEYEERYEDLKSQWLAGKEWDIEFLGADTQEDSDRLSSVYDIWTKLKHNPAALGVAIDKYFRALGEQIIQQEID